MWEPEVVRRFGRAFPVPIFALLLGSTAAFAEAPGAGENWPHHGGGDDESGYSRLAEIDSRNVGRLGLAWSLDLPGEQTLEATPLAVDGVLYFTGSHAEVYAVDAVSGELRWKHDPEIWKHNPGSLNCGFGVNRGPAYDGGRIFFATHDGQLHALDAATGALVWSVNTVAGEVCRGISGAPRVFDGKVIIGNSGGDAGARGFVTAYDQESGRQLWRFYTVPGSPEENRGDPAMERAAETWAGEYWKTGTGGTVWNGITFDPELNQIYLGTGNSGPYNPEVRSPGDGDNLYLVSIVALDADTGKYVWHYQMNPREAWDWKATMNIITATLSLDGKPRKVLMQTPSNGFFYVLDRKTGELLSAEKTGKVTWAERIDLETGRPVEAPNIRYETGESVIWPSAYGTHNWQAMSFSPKTGLVYIPYIQLGARFVLPETPPGAPPAGYPTILPVIADPNDGKGALLAWDPVAQRARWKVQHYTMWNGGTLATAGGLVFQGTADGFFSAYDAANGRLLWRFNAGLGIIAAPMSYSAGGRQQVSILVGWGGAGGAWGDLNDAGWKYGAQPRRILTFALDGKASLPPMALPDRVLRPVDDPEIEIDPADAQAGERIYLICSYCHGRNLQATGSPAPDLRESRLALSEEAMWTVLNEGTLLSRGMPRYQHLSREQVRQLHAYIRSGAREALAAP